MEAKGIEKVYNYLNDAQTYYLATVDDGKPRVRPFGTILLDDGKLYIQTGKVKDVSKQIAACPYAEICACMGPTWLRIQAELVEDDNREVKVKMLDKLPEFLLLENVPTILAESNINDLKDWLNELKKLGYHNSKPIVVDGSKFGVPQDRKRCIIASSLHNRTLELQGNLKEQPKPDAKKFIFTDYEENYIDDIGIYEGVESDNKEVSAIIYGGGRFNVALTPEEINILSTYMIVE